MLLSVIWALAGVTGVLAVVDWVAVARDDRRTEQWAKPATLIALIAVALAGGALEAGAGTWLVVALVFGLLGDVMLLGDSAARFQAGLAAFLVGHLAYVVCFVVLGLPSPALAVAGVAFVVLALGAGRQVLPSAYRSEGWGLAVPVAAYMLVISAMAITAWMTGDPRVALGASVFVASDTILAMDRFVRPRSWARPAIMVTYHLGQALIVWGVLAAS